MATLEQLAEGIKRAHAAGNAEHVKALGAAYRQMQAQQVAPAPTGPTIKVGGRTMSIAEYQAMPDADRQALRSQIADANPGLDLMANAEGDRTGPAEWIVPMTQGMAMGWADEGASAIHAGVEALQGRDFGSAYDHAMTQYQGRLDLERANNPVGSTVAEIGGAVAPAILTGGASLLPQGGNLGARVGLGALSAATQGAIYGAGAAEGDLQDRARGGATGGLVGGVVGAAAPLIGTVARRMVSPAPANETQRAAARMMAGEGVTLTAGQRTGNKGLQYLESELGRGTAEDLMERQSEEFTSAVLRRLGVDANRASPEVVEGAYRKIGQQFDNLAQLTNTPFDSTLQNNLLGVASDYVSNAGNPAPVVENMVNRIAELARQNGGVLSGKAYQEMRTTIGRLSRSAEPTTRMALRELQDALDDGVERHLNGQTLQAWQNARRAYQNFLVVERAVTSAGEKAASGLISPAQLRTAAVNQNRRAFAFGSSDYADLARAGVQTMTPLPQSGTAPRLAAQTMGSLPAVLGAAAGSPAGIPGAIVGGLAGAAIPRIAGAAMLSRPGRAILSNQLAAGPQAGFVERSIRASAPFIGSRAQ